MSSSLKLWAMIDICSFWRAPVWNAFELLDNVVRIVAGEIRRVGILAEPVEPVTDRARGGFLLARRRIGGRNRRLGRESRGCQQATQKCS